MSTPSSAGQSTKAERFRELDAARQIQGEDSFTGLRLPSAELAGWLAPPTDG